MRQKHIITSFHPSKYKKNYYDLTSCSAEMKITGVFSTQAKKSIKFRYKQIFADILGLK